MEKVPGLLQALVCWEENSATFNKEIFLHNANETYVRKKNISKEVIDVNFQVA